MASFIRSPLFVPSVIFGLVLAMAMMAPPVSGEIKCSSVQGRVVSAIGQIVNGTLELRDRDGLFNLDSLDALNPDDLMDRVHITPDGLFTLSGCADDPDWLWLANWPEPYLSVELLCEVSIGPHPGTFTRRGKTDVLNVYSPFMLSGLTWRV